MKKFIFAALFLLGACSVVPGIDASAEAQAKYKSEWIANMKGKMFKGTYNYAKGGGTMSPAYWTILPSGNLADSFVTPFDAADWFWVEMHPVLFYIDGSTVVIGYKFPKGDDYAGLSETDTDKAQVHVLQLRGNKIYRTAYGKFTTYGPWDKSSYHLNDMVEYGVLENPADYSKKLGIFANTDDWPGIRQDFDPKKL